MRNKFALDFSTLTIATYLRPPPPTVYKMETRRVGVYYNLTERKMLLKKRKRTEVRRHLPRTFPHPSPLDGQARRKPKSMTGNSRQICDPIYLPHSSDADGEGNTASHLRSRMGSCRPPQFQHHCPPMRAGLRHTTLVLPRGGTAPTGTGTACE